MKNFKLLKAIFLLVFFLVGLYSQAHELKPYEEEAFFEATYWTMIVLNGEASITTNLEDCLELQTEMESLNKNVIEYIDKNNILSAFPIFHITCDEFGFVPLSDIGRSKAKSDKE